MKQLIDFHGYLYYSTIHVITSSDEKKRND
jgi:hypothetical protein